MEEYISRNRLLRDPYFQEGRYPESHLLRMAIMEQPAANVAPVVRCKDCKHYKPNAMGENSCFNSNWNEEYAIFTSPDDFCSYGERKDGGSNG